MTLEKNESTKIIIGKCGLEFKCASPERLQHTRTKVEHLLKEFYCLEDHLHYPGLRAYVRSKEGRQFIDHLSNINQCVTELPDIKSQGKRFDYKSIIIGTAQTDHLKIHLVQGDHTDFNVPLKVEFCPINGSAEKMCSVTSEPSSHKIISLPPWKRSPSAKKDNLTLMRKSLQESLCLVLKLASQSNCTQLFFSTSKMCKTEFPFPVDCLAKSLINELINTFQPSIAQNGLRADVFICEMKSEAVFKAFTFYLKESNMPLKYPDQDTWDGISLPKLMSNSNKSFVAIIELMANNPDIWEDGILFCYPIQPELKSITCPAINEHSCSKQLLQDDLRKLLFKKPDGLAIGEPCRVNCFTNGKEALVYCFPKWGPGCDEAIHVALKSCLLGSAEYRSVHIIPPGLHVFPNYPLKYLVTTICQVLDQLLSEGILNKQRKIVLIVDNKEYRKEFRKELEHYFPESFETQWENRIRNKIWAPENKDLTEISNANKDILVSETSCKGVPIFICGHSKINTETTLAALNGKMHSCMTENSSKQDLNKNETLLFQKIIQNAKNLPVNFVLEKHYSNPETLPSKYLHVRGKESSERGSLEMRSSVPTSHSPGKSSVMESGASPFNTRGWGKSPSIMERRSSSFNTREGGKSPFSSRERGASPFSSRDRGKSPSGARDRVMSPCLKEGEILPREGVKSPTCARERGTSLHIPREGVKSPTGVRERGKSPHIPRERGTSPHIPREKGTSHIPRERRTSHSFREKGTFRSDSTERDKSFHYSQDIGNSTYSTYSGREMNSSILEGRVLTHRPTARGKLGPASFEIRKILTGSTLTVHGLSDKLIKMFMRAISDAFKANPHNLSRENTGFHPKVVDFEQSDEDSSESLISEDY
ncbi:unnamed protein product [Lymnaea stagnalis]|uniref:Uncharacterized protein n=1 Tax=Lymnaea stagnalis TaxID=6523 RepID=A0AAV2INL5_LYMST